jgi:hypothetical protein
MTAVILRILRIHDRRKIVFTTLLECKKAEEKQTAVKGDEEYVDSQIFTGSRENVVKPARVFKC